MDSLKLDGESLITPASIAPRSLAKGHAAPAPGELETGALELALILSSVNNQFSKEGDRGVPIDQAFRQLRDLRNKTHPVVWHSLAEMARNHPVADHFLQDPITLHSFEKPRGYSGDAELLDYIYLHPSTLDEVEAASTLGREIYSYTSKAPAAAAVRERRDLLTAEVDRTAARKPDGAEILTIAAGHLREANDSVALRDGGLKRWIALDQDPLSIGSITRDFHGTAISAIDGSVRGVLNNAYGLGEFDLVYAAGLYDYLPRAVAIKLTRKCMSMLKPGGSFLFANFSDEVWDVGYMETFMHWTLILRTEAEMWDIVNASVDRNKVDAEVFYGENRTIIYGRLTKRDDAPPAT